MVLSYLVLALAVADARPRFTSPRDPTPEYAHGLTPEEVRAGWIAGQGVRLGKGAVVNGFAVRPPKLTPLITIERNWKVVPHPTLPRERQAAWTEVKDDAGAVIGLRAVGGPGCVEFPDDYGDFVLQVEVTVRKPLSNGGVFFRCKRGDFLNGYEAQVFNGCYGQDPAKPARYATGAIDDRQNASRLVSRDGVPFTMTIVATGPHIATWVNGVQVTDWTDDRPEHDNPRNGRRTRPGPIQLQAHDKDTDVIFSNLRVAPLE